MSEPLSPADRGALTAEQGPINMAVAGAMIFAAGPGTSYEAVLERIGARLHLLPRYRQKLADPFGPLSNPVWTDDDGFDLQWHVRHARLPDGDLAAYVAREMATRLHRDRPLWELHVVDGLAGDRVALLPKMHHALVDGLAAIGIGMILLDPTPEPMALEGDEQWTPQAFDRRRHLAGAAAGLGSRLLRESLQRARDPLGVADELLRGTELITELARQRPQAPMTVLNEPLSPNRAYAMRSADLAALKAAGKAAGGTVNDAILATVAGALRTFLPDLADRPVALVPVSVRRDGDDAASGNRISTVFVELPIDEPDFAERVRTIGADMRALRDSAAVRAGAIMVGAAGLMPPLVATPMARAMGGVRAMNLVVSNVPGPQQTFYMNGAPMLEVYPAVPLNPANQRLNVGVMSYDGGVFFGVARTRAWTSKPSRTRSSPVDTSLFRVTVCNTNMTDARNYTKVTRAASEEATRPALLEAATEVFFDGAWHTTSLDAIAGRAGTTKQTLLRHFGSKDGLLEAGYLRSFDVVRAQRLSAPTDDIAGAVDNLLDHYEEHGERALRIATLGADLPVADIAPAARQFHYDWVEHAFGGWLGRLRGRERRRVRAALIVACDVHAWSILAHDRGLPRAEVRATLVLTIRKTARRRTHEDPGLHLAGARAPVPARPGPGRTARRAAIRSRVRTLASEVARMRERGFDAAPIAPAIEAIEHDDYSGESPPARLKRCMATFGLRAPVRGRRSARGDRGHAAGRAPRRHA